MLANMLDILHLTRDEILKFIYKDFILHFHLREINEKLEEKTDGYKSAI